MRRQVKGLNNTVYTLKKQYRRGRRIACHGLLGGAHAAVAGAVCGGGVKRVGRLSDEVGRSSKGRASTARAAACPGSAQL
jgi:hypothetical protein